ncbi:MAG: hypothetical protein AB7S26_00250 [Sandaracinaceae bacterium]
MKRALWVCGVWAVASLAHAQVSPDDPEVLLLLEPAAVRATPEPDPFAPLLATARAHDARTEYDEASRAYQRFAEACTASVTSMLSGAGPCGQTSIALRRAFELARALGQRERAERLAEIYANEFLYAEPREVIAIRHDVVAMYLDARDADRAQSALTRLTATHPDAVPGMEVVALAYQARIDTARGREARATRAWRAVERAWQRVQTSIDEDSPVPLAWVREAVAQGRLLRAERAVERFLAIRRPRSGPIEERQDWWRNVMSPWLVRSQRRLLIARAELERVYELGSPRHSIIAAARIGEMYERQAELHQGLELPDDDYIRIIVGGGELVRGYDQARTHLETCMSWATHHGVALDWAARCEEHLHRLDPTRYPQQAELVRYEPYSPDLAAPLPALP